MPRPLPRRLATVAVPVLLAAALSCGDGQSSVGPDPEKFSAPDIISHDFENGTLDPFGFTPGAVTVVEDPTGQRGGKVARIRYSGSGPTADINNYILFTHGGGTGYGQSLFFRAYLLIPAGTANASNPGTQRKLLYWRDDNSPLGYVLSLWGNQLANFWTPESIGEYGIATIDAGTWYRIEVQVTFNSARNSSDGVVRVWVDDAKVYERTDVQFSSNSDPTTTAIRTLGFGYQREGTAGETAINEDRYWDNVAFSRHRIGP